MTIQTLNHTMPVMQSATGTDYQLEAVWPTPSTAVREDGVRFWLAESALPNRPAAEERAHQLLVVARDANGQVAGVSTAVRNFIDLLGLDCFHCRRFVRWIHRCHKRRFNPGALPIRSASEIPL